MPERAATAEQRDQHAGKAGRPLRPALGLYLSLKVAVTLTSAVVRVTTQVPVPWHPLHSNP
jgi:hypothetical protein